MAGEIERAKELVNQMLTFSRGGDEKLEIQNPASLIKQSLKMLGPIMPSSIHIYSFVYVVHPYSSF